MESSTIIEYFQDRNERDSIAQILFNDNQNSLSEEIVSDCIKILKSEPIKNKISLLHCVTDYPVQDKFANLKCI